MDISAMKGLSFGLTSGIITTLGMMIGLYASTHSRMVVIGGIFTIAFADALSDALGMHISEESEAKNSTEHVWKSTISTWLAKIIFALTFLVPVLLLPLMVSVIVSILWGMALIASLSFVVAKRHKESPFHVILEHLMIAGIVIAVTYFIGIWVSATFV